MNSNNTIETYEKNTMDTINFLNTQNLPEVLRKYKVLELKTIAQKKRLNVSGTKTILIDRITTFYENLRCVIIIQKNVRRWFVRLWMRVRGGREHAAKKNHINDADFYSFEPIIEIPYKYYFSYNSLGSGNIYGFHIQSFIHLVYKGMISSSGTNAAGATAEKFTVLNPYNREPIPEQTIYDAFRFIRLYKIIFCSGAGADADAVKTEILRDGCENLYDIIFIKPSIKDTKTNIIATIQTALIKQNITKKLEDTRKLPLLQRVINLFMDIDLLGNYTSYTWFNNLTLHNTLVYWGTLYDIWLYRADILNETKKCICPFHDPFYRKILNNPTTVEEVIDHCLYAMENLVYMSPDEEYRKLGAMYVLCALTFVSIEARQALPWLYDIVVW